MLSPTGLLYAAMNAPTIDCRQRFLDAARELIYTRSEADVGIAGVCEGSGLVVTRYLVNAMASHNEPIRKRIDKFHLQPRLRGASHRSEKENGGG